MLNYSVLDSLLENKTPLSKRALVSKSFSTANTKRDENRIVAAMQPIEPGYTEKTFKDAEAVKTRLWLYLPSQFAVEFDYQGSVTSNTHIRLYSDIDLLLFHGRVTLRDYTGISPAGINAVTELTSLRNSAAHILRTHFSSATLDTSPGKSIAISGTPLEHKVDVVTSNWWDTADYQRSKIKADRGISILNSRVPETLKNKPFAHNKKLDEKDEKTGGLRKSIRLLKTLKYSSTPELAISSYDIASLVWNMYDFRLTVAPDAYVTLAENNLAELNRFVESSSTRDTMMVPNGTRKVFGPGGASLDGLKGLRDALATLLAGVQKQVSFSTKSFDPSFVASPWKETLPPSVRAHSF